MHITIGQICGFLWACESKKAFSFRGRAPPGALPPGPPLGAQPPDPRYWIALAAPRSPWKSYTLCICKLTLKKSWFLDIDEKRLPCDGRKYCKYSFRLPQTDSQAEAAWVVDEIARCRCRPMRKGVTTKLNCKQVRIIKSVRIFKISYTDLLRSKKVNEN